MGRYCTYTGHRQGDSEPHISLGFLSCKDASSLLNHDSLEMILVKTNVYSQAKPDPCAAVNACESIVSSCDITCPIDMKTM